LLFVFKFKTLISTKNYVYAKNADVSKLFGILMQQFCKKKVIMME